MQVERGPLTPLKARYAAKVVVGVGQVFEMELARSASSPGSARQPLAWRAADERDGLML